MKSNQNDILKKMRDDKAVRKAIAKRVHKFFFCLYLERYLEYDLAPLHEEMIALAEDQTHPMLVISGFRGCGKSTILTLSYPIWAIIGVPQKKFVVIVSDTELKAQILLGHIKNEFENNELLVRDLGPFNEKNYTWNANSLTLNNYGARIVAMSTGQSLRSLRYLNHRPDLIIIDDSETLESVKTVEGRDKLHRWLTADVIPAGDATTKIVVIGSMLHPDSLVPRLQKSIDAGTTNGAYRMYPIVDASGAPLWPARFPDAAAVEKEKKRGVTDLDWKIEYMLEPVADDYQVIKIEWINYYDRLPDHRESHYRYSLLGVDPAISTETTADCTAIVSGMVTQDDRGDWIINIAPYPINERLDGPHIYERIEQQSRIMGNGAFADVYIEDVGFQRLIVDAVKAKGITTDSVLPGGKDKRARLISISHLICTGRVRFPRRGTEKLIAQLIGFGTEKHDDLVDALVILVVAVMKRETTNTIMMPQPQLPPPTKSQKELEDEADLQTIIESNLARGKSLTPQEAQGLLRKKRTKDHWAKEEWEMIRRNRWKWGV